MPLASPLLWARQDSNLCRLTPTILQTASFSHSDTDPYNAHQKLETGLEPATRCLQNSRSTTELLQQVNVFDGKYYHTDARWQPS